MCEQSLNTKTGGRETGRAFKFFYIYILLVDFKSVLYVSYFLN